MAKVEETVTIKVRESTRQKLKLLAALMDMSMLDTAEWLVTERLQKQNDKESIHIRTVRS